MTRAEPVLVTGASGRVGRAVLAALSEAGARTRALVHERPVPEADEEARADLLGPAAALDAALRGCSAVINLAAATHARRARAYFELNRDGTERVLHAAGRAEVAVFVQASTRAVSEEGGAYSRSKLAAERLVAASKTGHVIVRLPEIVGAGSTEGVDAIISRAKRGSPVPIVGAGASLLCPVRVEDAAVALAAAALRPELSGRAYTLVGDCLSERAFAERCVAALGSKSRIVSVPEPLVRIASHAARMLPLPLFPDQLARLTSRKPAAIGDPRVDLGFDPTPLDRILAEIAAHN